MTTVPTGGQSNSTPATTAAVGQKDISRVSSTTVGVPAVNTTDASKESSTTIALLQPEISDVDLGVASVRVGDEIEMASVARSENQMLIRAGRRTVGVAAVNDLGKVEALDDDGNVRLMPGGMIRISLSGFDATAKIQTWLFSTPSLLGTEVVNADGSLTASYVLPSNIPSGEHRLAVTSQLPDSEPVTFTLGVGIGEMKDGGKVATWLIVTPLAMAAFGALVIPATRRRRRALSLND
jgi:hypothetical protein